MQQSNTPIQNKPKHKHEDYASELKLIGNVIRYGVPSTSWSFGQWNLIWVGMPKNHLTMKHF